MLNYIVKLFGIRKELTCDSSWRVEVYAVNDTFCAKKRDCSIASNVSYVKTMHCLTIRF